ncbi:MAG TPA: GNAT family N-acetyltransferase [Polyangiaceae bacterium]|jgi:GNAT superfamily N-acetyltransferase|nr:GNAT family N-acetyltransferase [Polyangiaceae bacterium]
MKTEFRRLSKAYVEAHARDFTVLIGGWEHGDWREANFTSDLEKKWEYSFGFFRDEQLVGFCMASGKIPTAYYVHLLFVSEEHRAFGVGKDFFAMCIEHCRSLGLRSIDLKCPVSNPRGLRFYQSIGFHVVDSDGADQTLTLSLA